MAGFIAIRTETILLHGAASVFALYQLGLIFYYAKQVREKKRRSSRCNLAGFAAREASVHGDHVGDTRRTGRLPR